MQPSGIAPVPGAELGSGVPSLYGVPLAAQMMNSGQPYRECAAGYRTQANGAVTPASGTELMTAVPLFTGDVVTNISFFASGALTMGTNGDGHLWFSLRFPGGTLIAQSADQGGSATWAAGSWKTLALSSPYTATQSGLFLAGLMINTGTGGTPVMASLRGNSTNGAYIGTGNPGQPPGMRSYAFSAGSGLGGSAPVSPALAQSGSWLYCAAS